MQRQTLTINTFNYLCELYDGYTDTNIKTYKKYVVVRNVNILGNTTTDKDIFFIPYDVFEQIVKEETNITDKYVFTVNNHPERLTSSQFSKCYSDFNDMLTTDTFNYNDEGGIVSKLVDSDNNFVECLCDTLRIYHPYNKSDLNYIIHIDNYINGIHFHYLCNRSDNYKTNGSNEIKLNNEVYSEYIEIEFPNLSFLFETSNFDISEITTGYNVYFEDLYNNVRYEHNGKISDILEKFPLSLLLHPFYNNFDGEISDNDKIYTDLTIDNYINYMSYPINITMYPFSTNNDEKIYMADEKYVYDVNTFIYNRKFTLVSTIDFINGELAIINTFDYPGKQRGAILQEAYAKYNGLHVVYDKKTSQYYCLDYKHIEEKEIVDDEHEELHCCGYKIEIATDYKFRNIVFSEYQEIHYIDDFAFVLSNIIKSWENVPNTLLIRITYIDKYIGMSLSSNFNILTKEHIKYMINDDENETKRLNIKDKQNMGWNIIDAKPDTGERFNFLNTVNVIVNKQEPEQKIIKQSTSPKILYKPIFYRTQDLQTIYIKSGLKQKIGINLSNYMSKVGLFKLILDNKEYSEYARNDVYVIFELYAGDILNTTGTYNITDDDNNFISDGKYIVNN